MTDDKQLDEWLWKEAQKAGVGETFAPEYTRAVAREYHRLRATDARPVGDEAETVWKSAYNEFLENHGMMGCGISSAVAVIRTALEKARSEATARAEKAERERDEANAVIAQIEKLPSVKMSKAIQMIIAQRTAPEKGE